MKTAAWRTRHNPNDCKRYSLDLWFSVSIYLSIYLSLFLSLCLCFRAFFFFFLFVPACLLPFSAACILDWRTFIPLFSLSPPRFAWLMINGADAPASRCAYWIQSPRRIIFVLQSSSAPVAVRNNEIGSRNNITGDPLARKICNSHIFSYFHLRFIAIFIFTRVGIFSLTVKII